MDEHALRILHAVQPIVAPENRGRCAARLAQLLNLSPYHAQRQFIRYCGETPASLQQRVILARAAARLRFAVRRHAGEVSPAA